MAENQIFAIQNSGNNIYKVDTFKLFIFTILPELWFQKCHPIKNDVFSAAGSWKKDIILGRVRLGYVRIRVS